MIGSIERVWRQMSVRPLMPVMMLVIVTRIPTDPNRKNPGYGGVVPVPVPSSAATSGNSSRPEGVIEQQHRDRRAARGRVLYSTNHGPQVTPTQREAKPQCDRRVVQGRSPVPAPNS
ncbi:MAG TPA: hypothetical protein VIP11_20400 [Gemmatimonadaceae bacterium]